MRTLHITISDREYEKFDLKADKFSFSELVDMISRELTRQNLNKTVELSERFGLSNMTMDDISKEIRAVRENADHS